MTELTVADLKDYLREDEDSNTLYMVLEAAKQMAITYTGQTATELDRYPDVNAAVLSLAADMYDNRTAVMQSQSQISPIVAQILGSYSINLIGGDEDGK